MQKNYYDQYIIALYDILDDVKATLSILNADKGRTINGPDEALFHRVIEMSYQQDRKHAVDVLQSTLTRDMDHDTAVATIARFADACTAPTPALTLTYETLDAQHFEHIAQHLAQLYRYKGQMDVIYTLRALEDDDASK